MDLINREELYGMEKILAMAAHNIESKVLMDQVLYDIENVPTIDAEPVRHGWWVNGTLGTECSCCGSLLPIVWCPDDEDGEHCIEIDETPHCPYCGAKMDGDTSAQIY